MYSTPEKFFRTISHTNPEIFDFLLTKGILTLLEHISELVVKTCQKIISPDLLSGKFAFYAKPNSFFTNQVSSPLVKHVKTEKKWKINLTGHFGLSRVLFVKPQMKILKIVYRQFLQKGAKSADPK